ncbi:MAG: protein kinase [Anaerolineae bacterium]|nr:protein kinase [Anaerolineae bacterium]
MIGRHLGSYRIVEQIGMGGMATVYKAYDPGMDRYIAIKVLPEHYAQDPTFLERFQREAKALAKLEHIHILPIFAYGQDDGITYLVMRYMQAGTLSERIKAQGPFLLHEAGRLLSQIAGALDYAHRHQVLHRDVKPSNVLLDNAENAYLTDFGIAKMVEATLDLTGTNILGTPAYMSPEQCRGGTVLTPASDQYSLGIVLYEMIAGRTPFQAETPLALIHMHLNAPLPLPRSFRPDLPEAAERVLLKALAREPQVRFDTCEAMASAFSKAIAGLPIEITAIPVAGPDDQDTDVAAETIRVMSDAAPVTRPAAGEVPTSPNAAPVTVPASKRRSISIWLWLVIVLLGAGTAGVILLSATGGLTSFLSDQGPIGQSALQLTDSSDRAIVAYHSSLDPTTAITIEAWIKIDQYVLSSGNGMWIENIMPIINAGQKGSSAGTYTLAITPDYVLFAFAPIDSRLMVEKHIPEGEWTHIAVSHTFGQGDKTRIYVGGQDIGPGRWVDDNGNPIDGNATVFPDRRGPDSDINAVPRIIGAFAFPDLGRTGRFAGSIDELRVWNIARAPNEIRATMRQELAGSEPGLVAYWNFNAEPGAKLIDDLSPNDNVARLEGGAKIISDLPGRTSNRSPRSPAITTAGTALAHRLKTAPSYMWDDTRIFPGTYLVPPLTRFTEKP